MTGNDNNNENKDFQQELAAQLKKKKLRKYALAALAAVILFSAVWGLTIEDKDSKLADGQGNVVTASPSDLQAAANTDVDKATDTNTDMDGDLDPAKDEKPKNPAKDEKPKDEAVDNQDDPTASNEGNAALKPEITQDVTVTVEIRCDNLSNHMSRLENQALVEYIPKNGVILAETTYNGTTDNTVFDVLNTVCRNNDIQLEFSYTPVYESYYIEGINYLYEFDGGNLSGWMYKVNDWFPNYGCSSYYLKDGDKIVWAYTCDLGQDLGQSFTTD